MTLEEYETWLADPYATRCLLCELTCFTSITEESTFYLSSLPYQTKGGDVVAICFDPRLDGDPYLSRTIPFFEKGRGQDSTGKVIVNNTDCQLDHWQAYMWRGGRILLLLGDPNWTYEDFNFKPLLDGIIEAKPVFSNTIIEFSTQDQIGELDGPIQINMLTSGQRKDEPVPISYGLVRNISPVCIDEALHIYKWSDGVVFGPTQVCDKAVPITGYTADNNTGTITLTSRPAGTITLTGKGVKSNGNWLSYPGEIILNIVTQYGPLELSNVDTNSLDALDEAKPYIIGKPIFERENRLDVLDSIIESLGAFYIFDFESKFKVGWLKNPTNETPTFSLNSDDIEDQNFSIEPYGDRVWRVRLGYERNYTIQKDGDIAGSISDPAYPNAARVEWLRNEYRTAKYENNSVVPERDEQKLYHLVLDPETVPTVLDLEVDAVDECTQRQTILGKDVRIVTMTAYVPLFSVQVGDIGLLKYNRYSLENGVNIQVLEIKYFILNSKLNVFKVELKGFFIL